MRIMLVVWTVVIIALGAVGSDDYQREVEAEQHYIDMVCEGSWPDYKNMNPECER